MVDCNIDRSMSEFYFANIHELQGLCVCKTTSVDQVLKEYSFVHIGLGLVGVVGVLLSLIVSSSIITKSSTAVLISVISLYNLLRFAAAGFLATFTLSNTRTSAQRACNFMWLLGSWGVKYTLLDLVVEQLIIMLWTDKAQRMITPMKAVQKTMLVLLLGLGASAMCLVHAMKATKAITCNQKAYYYAYVKEYSLYFVGVVHWILPHLLLLVACLILSVLLVHLKITVGQASHEADFATASGGMHAFIQTHLSDPSQQILALILGFSDLISDFVPIIHIWFQIDTYSEGDKLLTEEHDSFVYRFQMAELAILISAVLLPLLFLIWSRFRTEAAKMARCGAAGDNVYATHNTTSFRSIQSVASFRTDQCCGP